jgi:hypothetical protein
MNVKPVISFEENKLYIDIYGDRKTVKFPYPIVKIETFYDCMVVMIEPPMKTIFNENIYGVSYDGKSLWQIEKLKYVYEDSPFTGMVREGNYMKLCNWDGTDLIVNPMTGKIIRKGYSK